MMELMKSHVHDRRGTRPHRPFAALAAGLLTLAACGGSNETAAVEASPATTTDAPATMTTRAPATTTTQATTTTTTTTSTPVTTTTRPRVTTTTRATTTTFAPIETIQPTTSTSTTLVVAAPPPAQQAPIAPPADSHAAEPIIEVGSIVIPKIGVNMTMYEGIRLSTLDYGPGHWPGTAMPGQAGNVVVGGHRTSKHRVFRNIDKLVAGDEIIFRDGAGTHTYRVNRVEIVDPSAVWIVNPTPTPTATLFACHPPGSTKQRIVVFADLVG